MEEVSVDVGIKMKLELEGFASAVLVVVTSGLAVQTGGTGAELSSSTSRQVFVCPAKATHVNFAPQTWHTSVQDSPSLISTSGSALHLPFVLPIDTATHANLPSHSCSDDAETLSTVQSCPQDLEVNIAEEAPVRVIVGVVAAAIVLVVLDLDLSALAGIVPTAAVVVALAEDVENAVFLSAVVATVVVLEVLGLWVCRGGTGPDISSSMSSVVGKAFS